MNPRGGLQACLMVPEPEYNLVNGDFASCWRRIVADIRGREVPARFPCRTCARKNVCGYCPGFFRAETGEETRRSEYLCAIGQSRLRWLRRGQRRLSAGGT